MPLGKEHKARTRERIVRSAGVMFRELGYGGAGIDDLMAGAELTRGGFYAHFPSKEALFAQVVASDHGLLRQLRRRALATPAGARRETLAVLRNYLDPAHQTVVAAGCSFAALTGDVARSGEAVKAGYRAAFRELAAELLRRPGEDATAAWKRSGKPARAAALSVAQGVLGAAILASALAPGSLAGQVLRGAWHQLREQLRELEDAQGA